MDKTEYRCGECMKLATPGTWELFMADSMKELIQHLVEEHEVEDGPSVVRKLGWADCVSCGNYFRADHVLRNRGDASWCFGCALAHAEHCSLPSPWATGVLYVRRG